MKSKILLAALSVTLSQGLCAETVTLQPVADTGLFQTGPDNNLGTTDALQIGVNGQGFLGRGLFRFDIADQIPPGARIESAQVSFHVTRASTPTAANHTLTRVALSWNEGSKGGSQGDIADPGETTWDARRRDELQWTVQGGEAGSDFAANPSATTSFGDTGDYIFTSTPELVQDVQLWLDQPGTNFGWLLRGESELEGMGSRRVTTRDHATLPPSLTIEFTPMQINSIERSESIDLTWQGGTAPFDVEAASDPAGEWLSIASGLDIASASVTPAEGQRFLRVRTSAPSESARYRVTWKSTWSNETHPTNFPGGAHFSALYGATHDASVSFWEPGGMATPGIKRMAETGSTSTLRTEITNAIGAEHLLQGAGIGAPDQTDLEFDISQDSSLVTLVTMIAPSPDWFVGIHGVDLFQDGQWVETLTVALAAYDAGTDSGTTFTSSNVATTPAEPITQITPVGETRPFGTLTFERITP